MKFVEKVRRFFFSILFLAITNSGIPWLAFSNRVTS